MRLILAMCLIERRRWAKSVLLIAGAGMLVGTLCACGSVTSQQKVALQRETLTGQTTGVCRRLGAKRWRLTKKVAGTRRGGQTDMRVISAICLIERRRWAKSLPLIAGVGLLVGTSSACGSVTSQQKVALQQKTDRGQTTPSGGAQSTSCFDGC